MSKWNNFLEEIKQAESDLGNPREVWYRGHSNESWELIPSLLRQTDWEEKEKLLFLEFSQIKELVKKGTPVYRMTLR